MQCSNQILLAESLISVVYKTVILVTIQ